VSGVEAAPVKRGSRCGVAGAGMTIEYEPSDINEITWTTRWRGSIVQDVLQEKTIWMLTGVHIALLYAKLYLDWDLGALWVKEDNAAATALSLLVFFAVFYSGNCYARYNAYYASCMGMQSAVVSYAGLLRTYFPEADGKALWNACRFMVASVYLLYFELAGDGSMGGQSVTDEEWGIMFRLSLLHPSEREIIQNHAGPRFMLLQRWALDGMLVMLDKQPKKAADAALGPFQEQALALRGHCAAIRNTLKQPVPFPYYHTLVLMLLVNLLLYAYVLTNVGSLWSIPCFFVTAFVLLGFKETAIALSDPFGTDAVDFDTDHLLSRIMVNVKALLSPQSDYIPEMLEAPSLDES